ncbi:saccharopine dehydrogenase NADP-binding domain-containing protein [Candidatus Pacearchaeota archaeon]|nr:saccharopine dehydrogenase NADP-binding domain-containing protein [Candidatus Pacearchaeota archaeon]
MRWDFLVLGATGMQGKITSRDLLTNGYSVLLCGRDKSRIEHLLENYKKTKFEYVELRNIKETIDTIKKSGANIVVNCAEGDWNINVLDACIKAGVHLIDLGSDIPMTKDQLKKDRELKKKGLIHITGSGSVPGIGNVMLRYAAAKFDKIDEVDVGFAWDSNIKKFVVPFSIQSILEEFTAPAPFVWHKHIKKIMPFNSLVRVHHRAIEEENQFTCGHHPETLTFYNFCKDKGIKNVKFFAGFPDHSFAMLENMVELGLSSKKEIYFQGRKIKPVEFLTETLKTLEIPKGYEEKENLWVEIRGGKKKILMECIVPTLKGWEDAACNIDTGMPASIMAQMILRKEITTPGAFAPEQIVPCEPFFKELRKRKMEVLENDKVIN